MLKTLLFFALAVSTTSACWSVGVGNKPDFSLGNKYDLKAPDQLTLYGNKRYFPEEGMKAIYELFWSDPNLSKESPPNNYHVDCKVEPSHGNVEVYTFKLIATFNTSLGKTSCKVAIVDVDKQQISEYSPEVSKEVAVDQVEPLENKIKNLGGLGAVGVEEAILKHLQI
ncbi:unnamed protein product [Bursaphelenchus okinawaensis]|uniref:Uncharacterized protein n=1 Tax=Bursaphelenchus okinawaensis TaxID=465554 RepID=A0A811KA02_9BILA|nr:unnamed protein product [Bursaphelenchus okinawaensis]CAG9098718.1 unnamed protein product [Bursaphelenchus okinawaensis]